MNEQDYMTYYIKTSCTHCGKEIVIKVNAKTPIGAIYAETEDEQNDEDWEEFRNLVNNGSHIMSGE